MSTCSDPQKQTSPARYHVPGVVSHIHRTVLQSQPMFAKPGAVDVVLGVLNHQATIHSVHLHAVVVRRDSYDALISHTSAKKTARFLCVANKMISKLLRPGDWTCTFWNGDRPGIDLVTPEPEAWADKVLALLDGAAEPLLAGLRSALRDEVGTFRAESQAGPVLVVQVTGWSGGLRERGARFVRRVREGLTELHSTGKDASPHGVTGSPGDRDAPRQPSPRRRGPRFFGLHSTTRSALERAWRAFQLTYRQAAEKLQVLKDPLTELGFPHHCFGPPVPTPP